MANTLRILYVEDDPSDRALTRRAFDRSALQATLTIVETARAAADHVDREGVDLILSDYRLSDGTGLDVLEIARTREPVVPVVLVTGSGDVEAAVRLLKAGAADYVIKRPGYLDTLPAVLHAAYEWFQAAQEIRQTSISILYAEHDANDALLARRAFAEHGRHFSLDVVSRGQQAIERLQAVPYDILLLDHRLSDMSGIEVLKSLREHTLRVPVVMVTGQGDEETAVQAFKLGASDYVIKGIGYLAKLPDTVEHVLAQQRLLEEREALVVLNGVPRVLAAVRGVDELARCVVEAASRLLRVDRAALWLAEGTELRLAGLHGLDRPASFLDQDPVRADCIERAGVSRRIRFPSLPSTKEAEGGTLTLVGGSDWPLACSVESGGQLLGVLAVSSHRVREFRAAEERLLTVLADHAAVAIENARLYGRLQAQLAELGRAQAQLLQTEKIAAMGQLLAGVAHELNNPLAVVMGRAELLTRQLRGSPLSGAVEKLSAAAERCARIVKNFLALARRSRAVEDPRPRELRDRRSGRATDVSAARRRRRALSRSRIRPSSDLGRYQSTPSGPHQPGDERASRDA